jgi:hypothetical protein
MIRTWLRRALAPAAAAAQEVKLDEILHVAEVGRADFLIGDLFERRFGAPPPELGRHFVAFHKPSSNVLVPIGYVHYSPWETSYMCGGLVIDDRLYRRMEPTHRRVIRESGGIAELLLRESFLRVKPASMAIWGYVGNKQAEMVDLRVGFQHTSHPHVMVIWNVELDEDEKQRWIATVSGLGPF